MEVRELVGERLDCEHSTVSAYQFARKDGIGAYVGSDIDESLPWLKEEAQGGHRVVVVVPASDVEDEVDDGMIHSAHRPSHLRTEE